MILKKFYNESSYMLSECHAEDSKKTKLVKGFKFYIKYLIIAVILATLIDTLCSACKIPFGHVFTSAEFNELMKEHLFLILSLVVVVVPLLEETMFRLWQSYKRWHIAIPLFVITYEILAHLLSCPTTEGTSVLMQKRLHLSRSFQGD